MGEADHEGGRGRSNGWMWLDKRTKRIMGHEEKTGQVVGRELEREIKERDREGRTNTDNKRFGRV